MSRFAYEDSVFISIINATHAALDKMGHVNGQVLGLAGQMSVVNNSASGVKLAGALGDFNSGFTRVSNDLRALNEKASALLNQNRMVNADTDSAANTVR